MANSDLDSFVQKARGAKLSDEDILQKLSAQGWPDSDINEALGDLEVPKPPTNGKSKSTQTRNSSDLLDSREQGLKAKVFEYNIMFLNLWVAAFATFWIFNAFLFTTDADVVKFPLTALMVTLPLFLILFARIRRVEAKDPDVKRVAARVHLVQTTQGLCFIVLLVHTIFALFQFVDGSDTMAQQLISWFCTILIFGGIFSYYWAESHSVSDS